MSQTIWGATDRGPAVGTMRFPVDTSSSSAPGYLTVTEMATFAWASPTLVTPALGVATATTINKVTFTAPATGSTLTIADGFTLTVPANATVSGTNTGDQTTISGNAGSATAIGITDDTTTNATMYPLWVTTTTGNLPAKISSTKMTFNPSTGLLTTTALASGTTTLTSTSAAALAVGRQGATDPVLLVNANTASVVTGISITGAASGAGVDVAAISSATNESLFLSSKGTNNVVIRTGSSSRLTISPNAFTFAPTTVTAAATVRFSWTGAANTGLTGGTEFTQAYFNQGQTNQHASNTAITLQRDFRVTGMTHSFATSGGVITDAAAFTVDGPSNGSTNATLTSSHAIYVPVLALTNVTNGYGLNVTAPSGATNNYAAKFSGVVVNGGATPAIAAGAGAGGSPTVGIAGANNGGRVDVTTGSAPVLSSVVATITFTAPFPTGSAVILFPANAATALLSGTSMVFTTGSTTTFTITSGSVALTTLTAYSWYYQVTGY